MKKLVKPFNVEFFPCGWQIKKYIIKNISLNMYDAKVIGREKVQLI